MRPAANACRFSPEIARQTGSGGGQRAAVRTPVATYHYLLGGRTLHPIRWSRVNPLVLRPSWDGVHTGRWASLEVRLTFGEAMLRIAKRVASVVLVAVSGLLLMPANAYALSVSTAELRDGQLRVDGANAAPGVFVMVSSTTSSAGIRSDASGDYHVAASGFRADDCMVVVSDRRTFTATVPVAGCSPTSVSPQRPDPAPTGKCVITAGDPATYPTGDLATYFFETTGCDTTSGPLRWEFVGGRVPLGMTGPSLQGQNAGAVSGVPMSEGTFDFAIRVTDSTGNTDVQTFEITVVAPPSLG